MSYDSLGSNVLLKSFLFFFFLRLQANKVSLDGTHHLKKIVHHNKLVCARMCVRMCVRACMRACACVCTCVCTYVRTRVRTLTSRFMTAYSSVVRQRMTNVLRRRRTIHHVQLKRSGCSVLWKVLPKTSGMA